MFSSGLSLFFNCLRIIAAQLVFIGHTVDLFQISGNLNIIYPPPKIQEIGLSIFFYLSGFLIAHSLFQLRMKGLSFKVYFWHRFGRIYSTFIPALIIISMIDLLPFYSFKLDFGGDSSFSRLIQSLFLLGEFPWSPNQYYGPGVTLWSLAIEWWLYIVAGLLFFWRDLFKGLSAYPFLALGLCHVYFNSFSSVSAGPGIGLAWIIGFFSFFLWKKAFKKIKSDNFLYLGILFFIGYLTLLLNLPINIRHKSYHYGALLLMSGLLFSFFLFFQGKKAEKGQTLIREMADYSFSLYLLHLPFLSLFYEFFDPSKKWTLFFISFVLINLMCFAFAQMTERPFLKWKRSQS